jgi:hypothetical protein
MKRSLKRAWRYIRKPFTSYKDLIQENKTLHARLSNNSSELASKEQLLERLIKDLGQIDHPETKKIARAIKRHINNKNYWEVYLSDFNIQHNGYIDRIKKKYPAITVKQLRLCALIKSNLDNQAIADKIAGDLELVKKQKYRLKKFIKVPDDYTLGEWLNKI